MTGSAGASLVDIARRVVAEHAAGNTAFRATDAFQLADGSIRERFIDVRGDDLPLGGQ